MKSIGGINIVEFSGLCYAVPQERGPLDFRSQNVGAMKGVSVFDDLESLLMSLDD